MITDIALRVTSDLKNLSVALIKSNLLGSENWKLVGKKGDKVLEITSKVVPIQNDFTLLEEFRFNECFYRHAKEYCTFDKSGDYAFKLLDGSIIQICYLFRDNKLVKQRFSYFQRPYSEDEINFLDGFDRDDRKSEELGLVWLRFDYDPEKGIELFHPKAHMTVSNFRDCRIPVSSPMTSRQFISMVVLNFYETCYEEYSKQLKKSKFLENSYPETFFKKEKNVLRVYTG